MLYKRLPTLCGIICTTYETYVHIIRVFRRRFYRSNDVAIFECLYKFRMKIFDPGKLTRGPTPTEQINVNIVSITDFYECLRSVMWPISGNRCRSIGYIRSHFLTYEYATSSLTYPSSPLPSM